MLFCWTVVPVISRQCSVLIIRGSHFPKKNLVIFLPSWTFWPPNVRPLCCVRSLGSDYPVMFDVSKEPQPQLDHLVINFTIKNWRYMNYTVLWIWRWYPVLVYAISSPNTRCNMLVYLLREESNSLLESMVVLEEFCKELAAIAFVKYHHSSWRWQRFPDHLQ